LAVSSGFIRKDSRGLPNLVNQSHGEAEGANLAAEEEGSVEAAAAEETIRFTKTIGFS
jgi:hypothetical protein